MNKVYKRTFLTGGLGLCHSYMFVQFIYQAHIVTKQNIHPTLFNILPFLIYSAPVVAAGYLMLSESNRVQTLLDSKYTPIWVRITEQSNLFEIK